MKKTESITVRIFVSVDYKFGKKINYYLAKSIDESDLEKEKNEDENTRLIGDEGIIGSYGNVDGNNPFIRWADKGYKSLEELVKVIKKGADEHELDHFHFLFDYPENFFIAFGEHISEEGFTYWHGRKLTIRERECFVKAFIAISTKK